MNSHAVFFVNQPYPAHSSRDECAFFTFAEGGHGSEHIAAGRRPRQSEFLKFQIDRRKTAMAYNKARAEKKWLKWKEAEEKKLRELGVDEETIQRLHTYDWAEFNRERRYLQRQVEWSPYVDLVSAQDLELPVEDVESLMDSIEDMELLRILSKEDKLTIQIAFLKMSGYNGYEIAEKTGLTQKAVNLRMVRLRKKLKKFFEA
ncbi:sigma-70 family RNA polymerase sigma factor [Evtepia sp.]|uniref:sigma-70 family RNA polymerase sigma factor n=1 Tax=Evtepia sp. TaxID=2773933 RepID=UPI003990AF68